MPISYTHDNTAPVAVALPLAALPVPAAADDSSNNYDGTAGDAVVAVAPAAPSNTAPEAMP